MIESNQTPRIEAAAVSAEDGIHFDAGFAS
jgi:hypothetical protein